MIRQSREGRFTIVHLIVVVVSVGILAALALLWIQSMREEANKQTIYQHWGSWHGDVCQFAMGDASVRQIALGTSAKLLASLCDRRDRTEAREKDELKVENSK